MENPNDLIQRWRDRAADMETGDGAGRLAAYHLRFAADELASLLDDRGVNLIRGALKRLT